ncbi:hypothetical protein H0W26_06065, partial [Candidatus Dependentiae bacterium]|nr:hypothetical protein [Candidatus Dependentiae bacterium]
MRKNSLIHLLLALVTTGFFIGLEGANSAGLALMLDASGKIVVAGQTNNMDNGSLDIALARYNKDGTLDPTLNLNSVQPGTVVFGSSTRDETANAVALDLKGKIVVAGASASSLNDQWEIVRFNNNGSLDTTFNPTGAGSGQAGVVLLQIANFDSASSVAIDSQNRIVVAGTTNDGIVTRAAVARFTESGTLDSSFGLGSSIPGVFVLMLGNDTTRAGALTLTQDD